MSFFGRKQALFSEIKEARHRWDVMTKEITSIGRKMTKWFRRQEKAIGKEPKGIKGKDLPKVMTIDKAYIDDADHLRKQLKELLAVVMAFSHNEIHELLEEIRIHATEPLNRNQQDFVKELAQWRTDLNNMGAGIGQVGKTG